MWLLNEMQCVFFAGVALGGAVGGVIGAAVAWDRGYSVGVRDGFYEGLRSLAGWGPQEGAR